MKKSQIIVEIKKIQKKIDKKERESVQNMIKCLPYLNKQQLAEQLCDLSIELWQYDN